MWKLARIQAENFCSFKELEFDVPQNITTLVFGNNQDNDCQGSNGSGKSALMEVIALGLTGNTLRKVKIDEIIRDDANEARIALWLDNTMGAHLLIERVLSRKAGQIIHIFMDSNEVPVPSVNEANRYILDVIGLSKDDIYSNFILSKHKYVSFLSSSDKDKKELINRFSNGTLVDESIAALQADIMPLQAEDVEISKEVAYLEGKVATLKEQIANILEGENDAAAKRKAQMESIERDIATARKSIREAEELIAATTAEWDAIDKVEAQVTAIDNDDSPFNISFARIQAVWSVALLGELANYANRAKELHAQINDLKTLYKASEPKVLALQSKVAMLAEQLSAEQVAYTAAQNNDAKRNKENIQAITEQQRLIDEAEKTIQKLNERRQKGYRYVSELTAALEGTIECPACHHKWLINTDMTIEQINDKLVAAKGLQETISQEIESNQVSITHAQQKQKDIRTEQDRVCQKTKELSDTVDATNTQLRKARYELQELQDNEDAIQKRIAILDKQIADVSSDMFDDLFEIIDKAVTQRYNTIEAQKQQIATQEGVVSSLQESLQKIKKFSLEDSIAPLQQSFTNAESELAQTMKRKTTVGNELKRLTVQEARFVEFKTYLANSKVEALAAMTNQFLESIGSDIRIAFSGITVLRSGRINDKISISLLRDGVDCGSFEKFSQGERSRCELATILALQKLINTNCEDGKGLDLLVIDEVLDGVDEDGLASIFDTLNNLQMTSLVVSHGLVHENYQHRLIVTKQNGVSSINGNNL